MCYCSKGTAAWVSGDGHFSSFWNRFSCSQGNHQDQIFIHTKVKQVVLGTSGKDIMSVAVVE